MIKAITTPTTSQSLGALLKSARDILRKLKGINGALDRLPERCSAAVPGCEFEPRLAARRNTGRRRPANSQARTPALRSAAVPGCEFAHRPGACSPDWRRDAALTRRPGGLRYVHA